MKVNKPCLFAGIDQLKMYQKYGRHMKASTKRETKETSVEVSMNLEGSGVREVNTGIELLDFMLSDFASAGIFDLEVRAKGDLETGDHHTTEDVGITLGAVLTKLITKGTGSSIVPAGECQAMAAVRFGEPGYRGDFDFQAEELGGMSLENFGHFLRALAYNGGFTLHMKAEGDDDRRKIEAMAIALGRAIRKAARDGFEKR
ncbi:MAG TPA: imidazoleglycerol-phosphate dehydratase [Methanotrichaceae archaeon]|nr:imidazoleglycerol-phosphate dehydratase [Methanotrichaceae archaeon]